MAKRKGEFEVHGAWGVYKSVPRSERRAFMQALHTMVRGKTIEELKEESTPIIQLEPGQTHCPFCGTPLTPRNARFRKADDFIRFDCRPCDRPFMQAMQ